MDNAAPGKQDSLLIRSRAPLRLGLAGGGFMMFLTDPMRKDMVEAALRKLHNCGAICRCHFTEAGATAWKAP